MTQTERQHSRTYLDDRAHVFHSWSAQDALDWGIVGVWVALVVLILVRLTLMWLRFRSRRWLVTGFA